MSDEFFYPEAPLTDEQRRLKAMRGLDRLSQAEQRRWLRQQRAEALRTVMDAKAKGLPMRAVSIGGVKYELGEPATTLPGEMIKTPEELRRLI